MVKQKVNGEWKTLISFSTPTYEPEKYIKEAAVSDNTLTLTKKDDTTVTFTPEGASYTAGTNIQIANNVISATDTTYSDATTSTSGLESAADKTKLDSLVVVSGTNDGTNWSTITIGDTTKNIPSGGSGEPSAYLKSASTSDNTLTLTNKDDTTVTYTPDLSGKQDVLTAGDNIQINEKVISATDTTYSAGTDIDITDNVISFNGTIPTKVSDLTNDSGFITSSALSPYRTSADQDVIDSGKQATLTAGSNITITDNTIAATDTTYSEATAEAAGLMSSSDKSKLDGVAANATAVSVASSGTATDEISYITINGSEKKIAGGGSGEPSAYIKSASASGNTLTLTNKDDTTVTYTPDLSSKQNVLTAGSNIQITGDTISATDTTYSVATTTDNGLMSSSDKTKVDSLPTTITNLDTSSGAQHLNNVPTGYPNQHWGELPEWVEGTALITSAWEDPFDPELYEKQATLTHIDPEVSCPVFYKVSDSVSEVSGMDTDTNHYMYKVHNADVAEDYTENIQQKVTDYQMNEGLMAVLTEVPVGPSGDLQVVTFAVPASLTNQDLDIGNDFTINFPDAGTYMAGNEIEYAVGLFNATTQQGVLYDAMSGDYIPCGDFLYVDDASNIAVDRDGLFSGGSGIEVLDGVISSKLSFTLNGTTLEIVNSEV